VRVSQTVLIVLNKEPRYGQVYSEMFKETVGHVLNFMSNLKACIKK
jgi:hypothetical protein